MFTLPTRSAAAVAAGGGRDTDLAEFYAGALIAYDSRTTIARLSYSQGGTFLLTKKKKGARRRMVFTSTCLFFFFWRSCLKGTREQGKAKGSGRDWLIGFQGEETNPDSNERRKKNRLAGMDPIGPCPFQPCHLTRNGSMPLPEVHSSSKRCCVAAVSYKRTA